MQTANIQKQTNPKLETRNSKRACRNPKLFRKGTALVLVVVLLALLAIMGSTFVIMSRITLQTAKNLVGGTGEGPPTDREMDAATDTVIATIKSRLAEGLWGTPDNVSGDASRQNYLRLLGMPDNASGVTQLPPDNMSNQPWDAPFTGGTATFRYYDGTNWQEKSNVNVTGNPWLADITIGSGSQITNLDNATQLLYSAANANANASGGDNNGDHTINSLDNDSTWMQLPLTNGGTTYYAAVRIVDTCGMVNINTAWTNLNDPNTLGQFLSNVGLYGSGFNLAQATWSFLPGRTTATPTYDNFTDFQNRYVFRIENPDWAKLPTTFVPFDVSDEMELRYQWAWPGMGYKPAPNGSAGLRSQLETYWPVDGDNNTSNDNTTVVDDNATLLRRQHLTAYSFSRHVRSEGTLAPALDTRLPGVYNLQNTIKDLVGVVRFGSAYPLQDQDRLKYFVKCIYDAFNADNTTTNYADGLADANYHTWQYLANLVNYLDFQEGPIALDTTTGANNLAGILGLNQAGNTGSALIYGLKEHAAITEVVVTCKDVDNNTPSKFIYTYSVSVEVGNPWGMVIHRPSKVYIEALPTDNSTPLKESLSFTGTLGENFDNSTGFSQKESTGTFILDNSTGSVPKVNIRAISYYPDNLTEVPEDVFIQDAIDPPTVKDETVSAQRKTNSAEKFKALINKQEIIINGATLGLPNTGVTISDNCSGYATARTDNSTADTWIDNTTAELWDNVTLGSTTYYFGKLRNLSDLAAVPYVGYTLSGTTPIGVSQLLRFPDNTIHFNFVEGGIDNATRGKGGVFRDKIAESFKLLDRTDDNSTSVTSADYLNRMRLPGLINVNTAPREVLRALHPLLDNDTATAIIANRAIQPYRSVGEVLERNPLLRPATGQNFFIQQITDSNYNVVQNATKWTRIANLITVRSDTFLAYVLVAAWNNGQMVSQRREMVLFDRSLCNQPPLQWNSTSSQWEPNPKYVAPKVVARQVVE
ncbi:MAG: type II secretion system protein GspK [Phycisphaerae bacterium]